jgi:hypothetical protein
MGISHPLVSSPAYHVSAESRRFIGEVLKRSRPVPMITEFRIVLDRRFPGRVDDRSAEAAAARALQLRGLTARDRPAAESEGGAAAPDSAGHDDDGDERDQGEEDA